MAASTPTRTEHDSMGELQVPADALWGAQTQRALQNFPVSGIPMHPGFIHALGAIKAAAAEVNAGLGLLDEKFIECLQSPQTKARVQEDIKEGIKLSIEGTPTAYLNGRQVPVTYKGALGAVLEHLAKSGMGEK